MSYYSNLNPPEEALNNAAPLLDTDSDYNPYGRASLISMTSNPVQSIDNPAFLQNPYYNPYELAQSPNPGHSLNETNSSLNPDYDPYEAKNLTDREGSRNINSWFQNDGENFATNYNTVGRPSPQPNNFTVEIPRTLSHQINLENNGYGKPTENYLLPDHRIPEKQENPQSYIPFYQDHLEYTPALNESLRASMIIATKAMDQIKIYSKPNPPFGFNTNKSNIYPLKIELTHSLNDIEPAVISTSKYWIKIELMTLLGKYNEFFVKCVDELRFRYKIVAWKKSRGDGNCYFRAVISRYFEMLFGFYSEFANCHIFLGILENIQNAYKNSPKINKAYKDSIVYIKTSVEKLIEIKSREPFEAFNTALFWLQLEEFDLNLVRVSRLICYYSCYNTKAEWKTIGIYNKSTKRIILEMGTEAEGTILALLPLGLYIQVIQYNFFKSIHIETFPNDEESNIKISIVRRGGHYDILYTMQECELDLYNRDSATYHYIYYNPS